MTLAGQIQSMITYYVTQGGIAMIKIPEEGLGVWICSNMSKHFAWGDLTCKPEECQHLHGGLCRTWGIRYGLCDAQAYRITKANP